MWIDNKTHWAWKGPSYDKNGKFLVTPMPTQKKLDYITINKGLKNESKLCIGVWDDEKYMPLHRNELEWHMITRTFDANDAAWECSQLVVRPKC